VKQLLDEPRLAHPPPAVETDQRAVWAGQRAVQAPAFGFTIEEGTERALLDLKDKVALASPARMYEEVQKLFLLGEGEKVFQMLRRTGIFGVLFPHINAWLDTEEEGFPHVRVGKALEWVDVCVQSGKKVEPQVLFGLMFGQYIEQKWKRFRGESMVPLDALDRAYQIGQSAQVSLVVTQSAALRACLQLAQGDLGAAEVWAANSGLS